MRHVFGGFGVIAALILLAVSAAMNWQFGYSLGKTQFDSHILGAASIAADCMKALMPFFIFAAIRDRNWSQALGGSALWAVCILYAMSSAIGFASINRSDTTTTRAVYAAKYEDLRSELGRITQERSWLAKHRSAAAVQSEIEAIKQNLRWTTSKGCTDATLEESRELCTNYHKLNSELAAARQDDVLKQRAAEVRSRLAPLQSGPGISVADPQADIEHQRNERLIAYASKTNCLPELSRYRFRQVTRQVATLSDAMCSPYYRIRPVIVARFVRQELEKAAQGSQAKYTHINIQVSPYRPGSQVSQRPWNYPPRFRPGEKDKRLHQLFESYL